VVSVVIPTLNAEATLVRTLSALVPGVVEGLIREVVISDGGSTDSTLEIAEATGCKIIRSEASRGLQLYRGCAETKGDWLLVLHADSVVGEGWIDALQEHMKESPLRAGYFKLCFDESSWFARVWTDVVSFRANFLALPSGDHGLFLSRALYESAGGYKDQADFEDLSLALSLGRTRLKPIPVPLMTNADRFRERSWLMNQVFKSMRFSLYLLGVPLGPPPRRS
jgi:glycosyltransferase involved in cell wall biosynthesis